MVATIVAVVESVAAQANWALLDEPFVNEELIYIVATPLVLFKMKSVVSVGVAVSAAIVVGKDITDFEPKAKVDDVAETLLAPTIHPSIAVAEPAVFAKGTDTETE